MARRKRFFHVCRRRLTGRVAALTLCALPGVVTAAPTHHHAGAVGWTYRSEPDKLRGGANRSACVRSSNAVRLSFPYRSQALELCVRNRQSDGLSIYLDLPAGGQFECSPTDGCDVEVSYDRAAPVDVSATTPDDGSDDTIFLDGEPDVLEALLAAKRAVVEVTFYDAGDQQLIFNVGGLKWDAVPTASAIAAPN